MPLNLLLLADTHVPKRARDLPQQVWSAVENADVVFHAGDWVESALLDEFERRSKQLLAVHGNNDDPEIRRRLPETAAATLDGVRFTMVCKSLLGCSVSSWQSDAVALLGRDSPMVLPPI